MSAKWTFWAWEQQVKTAPKKLALLQLANNANDDGKSWYSIKKMAAACGVGDRTFQRQIQSLEQDGLLHVERRSNRPSVYTLSNDVEITLQDSGCQSDVWCQSGVAGCQSGVSGGVTESHDPNIHPDTFPDTKDLLSENSDAAIVLQCMNELLGAKYKASTKSHIENISARLSDGHSIDDLKLVIAHKKQEWGSDPKMAQYLRPSTLFQAGKCQGYLMAAKTAPKSSLHNLANIQYTEGEL